MVLGYTHHQGFGVQGLCRGSGRAGSPIMGIYREKEAFRVPGAVQRLGGSQRSNLGRRGKRGTNSTKHLRCSVPCAVIFKTLLGSSSDEAHDSRELFLARQTPMLSNCIFLSLPLFFLRLWDTCMFISETILPFILHIKSASSASSWVVSVID